MVKEGSALLMSITEKRGVDRAITNPLSVISQLVEPMKMRLDHPVGSASYGLGRYEVSPFTRDPIMDVLVFGCTDACKAYTDRTMARLLSSVTISLGNMDLWFALVLEAIEQTPYLFEVVEAARDHMRWRLSTQSYYAGLLKSSRVVTTRMQLGACCWYVISSCLVRDESLPITADVSRQFAKDVEILKKLCGLINYHIPEAAVRYCWSASVFPKLMSCARGKKGSNALQLFQLAIRSLWQNAWEVNSGFFIPLDGDPNPTVVLSVLEFLSRKGNERRFLKAPITDLVALAALVDPSKAARKIKLEAMFDEPVLPHPVESWPELKNQPYVKTCPKTGRKFVADKKSGSKSFSPRKVFTSLTEKFGRYPTLQEVGEALYEHYKDMTTLPARTQEYVEGAFQDFQHFIDGVDVESFLKIRRESKDLEARRKMEEA